MSHKSAAEYEAEGDTLKGEQALRAYRRAKDALRPWEDSFLEDEKRLEGKIAKEAPDAGQARE